MSKEKRNIIIGIAAIVILAAVYFGISTMQNDSGPSTGDNAQNFIVNLTDASAAKMTLSHNGETVTLEKKGTRWVASGYEEYELKQAALDMMAAQTIYMPYTRIIAQNQDDMASFGLNSGYTIAVEYNNGTSNTFTVGDITSDGSGYYLVKEDAPEIYLISRDQGVALCRDFENLRENTPDFIDYGSFQSLQIWKDNGETYCLEPNPDSIQPGYDTYIMTEGYNEIRPVQTQELYDLLIQYLEKLRIEEYIDDPDALEVYGLDAPKMRINAVSDYDTSMSVEIGATAPDGMVYGKYEGHDYVCKFDKNIIDAIDQVKPFQLIGKYLLIDAIDSFSSIELSGDGLALEMAIGKNEDGTDYYAINGKEASEETMFSLYETLMSLTADGENIGKTIQGDAYLQVMFTLTDGTQKQMDFYPYDDNFDAVAIDGASDFLTGRKAVQDVIALFQDHM